MPKPHLLHWFILTFGIIIDFSPNKPNSILADYMKSPKPLQLSKSNGPSHDQAVSQKLLLNSLAYITLFFQKGIYPSYWKLAIIIPILKLTKNPSLHQTYRPIFVHSTLRKILEECIRNAYVGVEKIITTPANINTAVVKELDAVIHHINTNNQNIYRLLFREQELRETRNFLEHCS